jgi:glycosyltransferase involved in cell wall biosynthesis
LTAPTVQPPSIVHVIWEGRIGGIERLVHQMASRQTAAGMGVAVAFAQPVGPFARALAQDGVEVVDLGVGSGFDIRPHVLLRTAARLRRFDVLHLHAFNVPLGIASVLSGRPTVFTEHGSFGVGRRFGAPKRHLQKLFLRRPSVAIAANSRFTAGRIESYYGFAGEKVQVVPNGVEFGPAPDQSARSGSGLVVGFVGRWAEMKRLDRLLRAVALARRRADVRLVMVGGGPYEEQLRRLALDLEVSGAVDFVGPRIELDDLVDRMDVLVQTGVESFGLSIVEACGRGALPIVFADGGGAVEVLPPDGVVVDSVEALADALATLRGGQSLCAEARARRAAWARETYDIRHTVDGYRRLYERVLENG